MFLVITLRVAVLIESSLFQQAMQVRSHHRNERLHITSLRRNPINPRANEIRWKYNDYSYHHPVLRPAPAFDQFLAQFVLSSCQTSYIVSITF